MKLTGGHNCARAWSLLIITSLLLWTLFAHVYDLLNPLPPLLSEDPFEDAETSNFTVFFLVRNRHEFHRTMTPYVDRINSKLDDVAVLFDLGSDFELPLPLYVASKSYSKVIRMEKSDRPFSPWEGLAFALKHISSRRIFFFDNCNYPNALFRFESFLGPGNYYFPNNERYFATNIAADRKDVVRLLRELPPHIASDPRSFFGGDQILVWYLNARRIVWGKGAPGRFSHIPHDAAADYGIFRSHSVVTVRSFLYLSRYGHPLGPDGWGNMEKSFCYDKRAFCIPLVRRFLALWGVYHVLDATLRLEFLWLPFYALTNVLSGHIVASVFLLVLCAAAVVFGPLFLRRRWERRRGGIARALRVVGDARSKNSEDV